MIPNPATNRSRQTQRLVFLGMTTIALACAILSLITAIAAAAQALVGEYGADDTAVLNVLFGKAQPEGKLPFELPSSMEAVKRQKEDLPHDSENPLYPFGFGLTY